MVRSSTLVVHLRLVPAGQFASEGLACAGGAFSFPEGRDGLARVGLGLGASRGSGPDVEPEAETHSSSR